MKVICRPISVYPVPETRSRRDAPFFRKRGHGGRDRILLSDSLNLLDREARMLGCRELVIEADFTEGQIRQYGWPYASARPRSPRVVVSLINSKHGPLRYPCDTFTRFEDNVRAIGLALEALRMVDRYGVTRRGEQYAGWKALPGSTAPTMTTEAAAETVHRWDSFGMDEQDPDIPGLMLENVDLCRAGIRGALRRTHPDTRENGATDDDFHAVQTARAVLAAHHGVSL